MRCPPWLAAVLAILLVTACAPSGQPSSQSSSLSATSGPASRTAATQESAPAQAAPAAARPDLGTLRFMFPLPSITMLPMHIASVQGFDKEEGFTATFIQAPGTIGVRALQAGEADFSMSAGASLAAAVQGAAVRIVAVHVAKSLFWLYTQPAIKQIGELPGKSIGVDAIGGSQDVAARLTLQRQHVDPASLYFISMGGSQIPGALIAGAIDSGVVAPPQDIQLAREGTFTNLGFLGDELPSLTSGLGTMDTTIAQRPEVVRAAVRAAMKGQRFLQEQREASLPIMADYLSLSVAEAGQSYDNTVRYFTADGRVSAELQQRMVRDQIEAVKPEREPVAEDLFALQFLD